MTAQIDYQCFLDEKSFSDHQHGFNADDLNPSLFDFQRALVRWACKKGRAAIFADTGLGKTLMQCEWAHQVTTETNGKVLIIAPLCVARQTVENAQSFGISVEYLREPCVHLPSITITNYEMMHHFDMSAFDGVVLDESSILKHQDSKTRKALIHACRSVPYRLSCTATPSPNDFMELGSQAEFLGIMSSSEMLAMFFTHDGGETSKWRLKGHGKSKFWEWLATWSAVIRKPSDLGFSDERYDLPPLSIHQHEIETDPSFDGDLFMRPAQTLMERRQAKRQTLEKRVEAVADLVNDSNDTWLIWCHLNDESDLLAKLIPDAEDVKGSDSLESKENRINAFSSGRLRVLITKPSIAGFGMNWQHCHKMAFVGLSDSFEQYYQAVRRCYRFGQQSTVDVHLVTADIEGNVLANLMRKESQHNELSESLVDHMRTMMQKEVLGTVIEKTAYKTDVAAGDKWTMHLGDCVEIVGGMDEESIDYTIFSPPFSSLYTYSNSDRDMGNSSDDEMFYKHFQFLVSQMFRVTRPGRLLSFHCMNLPTSKQNHGYIGIRDFRGELIRLFTEEGWIYHSEVCIWKDPVTAMQRTKALGLLHKTIRKDSAMSRQGIPDYLVTMRKPGDNEKPISHTAAEFPVQLWQRYASPVWMDINPSKTLQYRTARDNDDERHICPLQLEVIERAIELWTAPDDLVLSPFAGIGSEGYTAIQMGRRFVGCELKPSYFDLACKNLVEAKTQQGGLFA